MPKLGLGLSLPQTRITASAPLIPTDGLSLWLKADAGVSTSQAQYATQIVVSGAGSLEFNGTYIAASEPDGEGVYSLSKEGSSAYIYYNGIFGNTFNLYSGEEPATYTSENGATWAIGNVFPSSIVISNANVSGANGTYTGGYIGEGNYRYDKGTYYIAVYPGDTFYLYGPDDLLLYGSSQYWGSLPVGAWYDIGAGGTCTGAVPVSFPALPTPTGVVTNTNIGPATVTTWADQSGNGNNFTPASGTVIKSNNIIGSNPAVLFEGGSLSGNDIVTAKTIYAVIKTLVAQAEQYAAILEVTGGSLYSAISGTQWGSYYGSESPSGQTIITETASIIATLSDDGINYELRRDGQQVVSGTGSGFTSRSAAYLGNNSSAGQPANVYISEIVVYNRVITTEERQQVEQYLNSKYQIYPWRVTISGAGTTTSNEEYAWDGVTTYEGKPQYDNPNGGQIYWYPATGQWLLYDNSEGSDTYNSTDLITWDVGAGLSPAPTSTLSYTP
jgi:hypothetical protein